MKTISQIWDTLEAQRLARENLTVADAEMDAVLDAVFERAFGVDWEDSYLDVEVTSTPDLEIETVESADDKEQLKP